jgi:radical SAM protein with 4Fe4S-binding SPASM domain
MQNLSQADWGSMKLRFGIPFSGLFHQKLACNAGISKLIIRYDGVVLPCEAFKCARFDNFKLGHIHTDSLSEMLVYGKFHRQMNFLKDEAESYLESCPAQIHWAA